MRNCGHPEKARRGNAVAQVALTGVILVALAGCSAAHVSDVTATSAASAAPVEILVDARAVPSTDAVQQIADKVQSELIQRLTEARITAEPFVPGTRQPGAAVLHVSITKADPGNFVERFVIGFGLGRAELQASANLESTDDSGAVAMTAFTTSSSSGRLAPGLVLPAGIALATRNLIHLAIGGGIKLATSSRGDLDSSARSTATAVVAQLKKYYASTGWYWPETAAAAAPHRA